MQLVTDNLKNPILDYVQHIVLSPPGSSFTCATASSPDGQTYTKYSVVKEDFLKGEITPEQLKAGLIVSLNELLQPVRDHFTNDETAKGLLDQVREFKRQSSSAPVETKEGEDEAPKCFHLDLVKEGVVPASSHLVLAPLPNSNPTLQSAADILTKLKSANDGNTPKVLMLLDWTACVNNALDADPKLISAYYSVLLASLRALDVHLHGEDKSIMKGVTIVTQSDAILKDPSNYWISVINAGRHFSLDVVMGQGIGLGEGMKDSEGVGNVIGRLMLIADVMAVNPKSIALDPTEVAAADGVENMSLEDKALSVEAHLIQQFYATKLSHPGLASVLPVPEITHVTTGPKLALQPPRESAAHKTEFDEYFLVDDPKVNGKSKMKKAFCEPGNVEFCPPIELLAYFGGLDGDGEGVTISRSPENGGNVTYTTKSAVLKDFESGALHPGDLKGAISTIMVEVLTKTSEGIKADKDAAKAVKALKAFEKKMAKQKKK
jgi:tyrosyl-tRNA synthetase